MAVIGIGVDLVDIARFERALTRTPALRDRLFAPDELLKAGRPRPTRSLAGRFAAKEALIKALGDSWAMRWHDMTVTGDEHGKPSLHLHSAALAAADSLGVARVHLSMSHDAGMAIAVVMAES